MEQQTTQYGLVTCAGFAAFARLGYGSVATPTCSCRFLERFSSFSAPSHNFKVPNSPLRSILGFGSTFALRDCLSAAKTLEKTRKRKRH